MLVLITSRAKTRDGRLLFLWLDQKLGGRLFARNFLDFLNPDSCGLLRHCYLNRVDSLDLNLVQCEFIHIFTILTPASLPGRAWASLYLKSPPWLHQLRNIRSKEFDNSLNQQPLRNEGLTFLKRIFWTSGESFCSDFKRYLACSGESAWMNGLMIVTTVLINLL